MVEPQMESEATSRPAASSVLTMLGILDHIQVSPGHRLKGKHSQCMMYCVCAALQSDLIKKSLRVMLCTIKTSLCERNLLFPQNKLGREVINASTAFLFRLSCMMALTLEGYIPMLFGRRMLFMSPLWGEYNLYRFLLIFILILFMPLPTRGRL